MDTLKKVFEGWFSYVIYSLLGVAGSILTIRYNVYSAIAFFAGFLLISVVLSLILGRYRRTIKVLSSGAKKYYYTFPPSENAKVWNEASGSFKYLGVTSGSIGLNEFLSWANNHPQVEFSFLLANPDGKALALQKAHQRDKSPNDSQVQVEVETDRKCIQSNIALLKTSNAYRIGKLHIKLYDEFVPWWMYIFNDDTVYLGVLPRGGVGTNAPVLIIKRNIKYPSIFDPFMKMWERLWDDAKDV